MFIKYSEKLKMTSPSVTWDQVQKKKKQLTGLSAREFHYLIFPQAALKIFHHAG